MKKVTKEEWKREVRKAKKEGRHIPGLPGEGGRDDLILARIVLRIERLEWEMAHLRKSRRRALLILKRAEKVGTGKAEKG